jgi:hypothetical protein
MLSGYTSRQAIETAVYALLATIMVSVLVQSIWSFVNFDPSQWWRGFMSAGLYFFFFLVFMPERGLRT